MSCGYGPLEKHSPEPSTTTEASHDIVYCCAVCLNSFGMCRGETRTGRVIVREGIVKYAASMFSDDTPSGNNLRGVGLV